MSGAAHSTEELSSSLTSGERFSEVRTRQCGTRCEDKLPSIVKNLYSVQGEDHDELIVQEGFSMCWLSPMFTLETVIALTLSQSEDKSTFPETHSL